MPDENKLQSLEDAGFQVKRTCYRCAHFDEGARGWGTCRKIIYEHKKHTGAPRQASVPVDGWCSQNEVRTEAQALLKGHSKFMEKTGFIEPCECGQSALVRHLKQNVCADCYVRLTE